MITGIDRLYLSTKNFDVSGAKLNTKTVSTWQDVPNIVTGEAEPVEVIHQVKFFNDKLTGLTVDVNEHGALVKFNPNRILTGNHHELRPQGEVMEAVQKVSDALKAKHIDVDFNSSFISHIDLCKQAELSYPIQAYFPAFEVLSLNRLQRTGYENGYYFSSSHSEVVMYGKSEQCAKKFNERGLPETLTRLELRLNDKKTVSANLKANSLQGLNMVNVEAVLNTYAVKRVFNGSKQLSIHPASDALGKYLKSKENGLLTFVHHLLILQGGGTSIMGALVNAYGTMEAFRHECVAVHGMKRNTFKYALDRLKRDDSLYQAVMVKKGTKTVDLIEELKTAFQLVAGCFS